ncbi:MAG: ATP synthase F1 subunit epsilon [Planctomycetes bacterium]|nr:ATP synthase F1 subunit epsilon [Planctomycetota bacterium]
MSSAKELRLVLVTPETTLLDQPVESLQFPLFDGQIGILPGRAPFVGRLGFGELEIAEAGGKKTFYVDGGFVQVKGPVVSVLTNRAVPVSGLNAATIQTELDSAQKSTAHTDAEFDKKFAELERARKKLSIARRGN